MGYDNAEGKGHHRHYRERESAYDFKSVDKLILDFKRDIGEMSK